MKSLKLLLLAALLFLSLNLLAQTMKTEKIKVYGNCNICKKNIEAASKTAGATSAEWNKTTKWLTVTYDLAKVSNGEIQKKYLQQATILKSTRATIKLIATWMIVASMTEKIL